MAPGSCSRAGCLTGCSLAAAGRVLGAKARDIKFQQHRVMDQAIDRRGGGHLIAEDPIPVGKDQIAGDEDRSALVAFGEEREENLGLLGTLLDVADIVDLCGAAHNSTWTNPLRGRP